MSDVTDRLAHTLAGRYALEREIGRGGMATVYLAEDLKHHREVAVKVLNPELAAAVGPERFLREIEIAARLSHPHILPLYDSGRVEQTLYYVMPFVQGESLQDRLERERQLAIEEAVGIAREVADALSHAHAHDVIHRDIKPANVMLVARHAMVADFGVALLVQAVAPDRLTESGVTIGTPLYMSPEQSTGQRAVDGRSDIYALGCVLYEMLTGEPPFTGATSQVIVARKMTSDPAPIRLVRESVSEELEAVVFKALARTAADRFRTAAEFADALGAVQLDYGERGPTGPGRVTRAIRDRATEPQRAGTDGGPSRADSSPAPSAPMTPVHALATAAAIVLLPTAVGFVSTTVYDVALHVPYQYTPSRTDFPIIGIRALIPVLFSAAALLVGYTIARQLARMVGSALRRGRRAKEMLDRSNARVAHTLQRLDAGLQGDALPGLWFAAAILAAAVVVGWFYSILDAANDGGAGILACAYRDVHTSFTFTMTVLVVVLATSWSVVFRRRGRQPGGSVPLARWGGIALIAVLVLITTAPWRLLWTASPHALLDGQPFYVLGEVETTALLYNPRTRRTELHPVGAVSRLNTAGYIFEDERAFGRPELGCY